MTCVRTLPLIVGDLSSSIHRGMALDRAKAKAESKD